MKLTQGGRKKLGQLFPMSDLSAAEAIRARGGGKPKSTRFGPITSTCPLVNWRTERPKEIGMQRLLSKSSSKQRRKPRNTAGSNELPIGQRLIAVRAVEDQVFEGHELCLDELRLEFEDCLVILRPLPDTDEVELAVERIKMIEHGSAPQWAADLLGRVLQTVWTAHNTQGYTDQVSFAFAELNPTLAVVSEGSILKVFRYQQLLRSERNGQPPRNRRRRSH